MFVGAVKILGKIAGSIEGTHAKVEMDMRVGSVEANAGKGFGSDNDLVARCISSDDWVRGDAKRGWNEGMEAGGVAQSDAFGGILGLFGRGSAGSWAHVVAMAEGKCNLCAGALYQYLVKPRFRRGLNRELVVRRGTQCAGGTRTDAKTAFTSSSVGWVAVRVDDAHRENLLRILICVLSAIKDLEFALGKIANWIMILVSRYHIQYHLAGGDTEDHWRLGWIGGLSVLGRHRKIEQRGEAGHNQKIAVSDRLAGHHRNSIAAGEGSERKNLKGMQPSVYSLLAGTQIVRDAD